LVVVIGQCPWFFHTVIPWATLFWLFFRKHLFRVNYRGFRYVREMLKMLPEMPEPILLTQIFTKLTSLGRIHPVSTGVEPS
jgi:hypothetical protein